MTEQHIKTAVAELAEMTIQGKSMDAFEKFYADDIEKADLDGVVATGKAANRQIGLDLIANHGGTRLYMPGFSGVGQPGFYDLAH